MEKIVIYQGKKADAFKTRIRLYAKAFKMQTLEALPDDEAKEQVEELSNKLLQADGDILNLNSEIETLKESNIRLIEEKKVLTDKVTELEAKLSKIDKPEPIAVPETVKTETPHKRR